jgi:hypothetical protein
VARVNVDAEALQDLRFRRLGRLLGMDHFAALGRMIYVWYFCTVRETYFVSRDDLTDLVGVDAWAALEEAELGEVQGDVMRIKGTKGRTDWLAKKRAAGKKGGDKRAPAMRKQPGKQSGKQNGPVDSRVETPPAPALDPALALDPVPALAEKRAPLSLESPPTSKSKTKTRKSGASKAESPETDTPKQPPVEIAEFKARWGELYAARAADLSSPVVKYAWTDRDVQTARLLLKDYGLEEACRRAGILFTSPPSFLNGQAHGVDVLKRQWNLLIAPVGPPSKPKDNRTGHFSPTGKEDYSDIGGNS